MLVVVLSIVVAVVWLVIVKGQIEVYEHPLLGWVVMVGKGHRHYILLQPRLSIKDSRWKVFKRMWEVW